MSDIRNRNILELSAEEACSYFLKGENYCNFDLPTYFKFEDLIVGVSKKIRGKKLSSFYSKIQEAGKPKPDSPRNYDDVNYKILNNKDGRYAWRPLQLIHPALYVSLVHKMTTEENWNTIRERFNQFKGNSNIECMSLPRESLTENSDKAEQVTNWWQEVEQRSIELALDFDHLTHTV